MLLFRPFIAHLLNAIIVTVGDLLETAEDMLKKAQERRLSKQQLLKVGIR